ncbi:MAG: glutamate racemase [Cyclobacteriaceae bacterium]|nr:glutamate racemase [Cytophagales bacterium]MBX2901489.1 glutamate racemase [Cyclobacteriaceae bacterium]
MKKHASAPVGIFDSGIGGLTVAHAIQQQLPHENLIYFGDTAHLPYGDKSEAAIQAYSIKIADVLLKHGCKVIVIACNSASSAAYELLKEYVRHEAHIINVIDPMVEFIATHFAGKTIGLIGTKRTVQSGVYPRRLELCHAQVTLKPLATPLLAPMIEEGFFNNQISHEIIQQYLSDETLAGIEALVLACTHYPLIQQEINHYYQGAVPLLDSAATVARALQQYLQQHQLLAPAATPRHQFFVSDYTDSFEAATQLFFKKQIRLNHYPLWN